MVGLGLFFEPGGLPLGLLANATTLGCGSIFSVDSWRRPFDSKVIAWIVDGDNNGGEEGSGCDDGGGSGDNDNDDESLLLPLILAKDGWSWLKLTTTLEPTQRVVKLIELLLVAPFLEARENKGTPTLFVIIERERYHK